MGSSVLTKAWTCPACAKEFIVASETTKHVCPWCNTPVQENTGKLEKASASGPAYQPKAPPGAGQPSIDGYPYCLEVAQTGGDIAS